MEPPVGQLLFDWEEQYVVVPLLDVVPHAVEFMHSVWQE